MQLKIKRSQRNSQGLVGSKLFYVLDARAELTAEELSAAQRYGLMGQVVYNSKASEEALAKSRAHNESGSWKGTFSSFAYLALAAMNLNITINGLIKGTHIECKDLDELLGAEEALIEACKNLRTYLETAKTFDGREVILDFTTPEPEVIAPGAVVKPPQISAPAQGSVAAAPALAPVPVSPAPPVPPVSASPARPPVSGGDIPAMPPEAAPLPPPHNGGSAQVPDMSAKPVAPADVEIAPPFSGDLPPVPPVDAPYVPGSDFAQPQLTRLSDGSYSADAVEMPSGMTDFLARAKESFSRLNPVQQIGVAVAGLVVFIMILRML